MKKKNLLNPLWGYIFNKDDDGTGKDKVQLLKKIPIFNNLSNRELKKLGSIIHEREYQTDEYMFEKGQPGAAMFIIKSGEIEIIASNKDGNEIKLASLEKGTFLGELALLDDSPRSASAKAVEPTNAMAFFRSDFNKLLETEPHIASKIYRELTIIIGERLKATNEQLFGKSS